MTAAAGPVDAGWTGAEDTAAKQLALELDVLDGVRGDNFVYADFAVLRPVAREVLARLAEVEADLQAIRGDAGSTAARLAAIREALPGQVIVCRSGNRTLAGTLRFRTLEVSGWMIQGLGQMYDTDYVNHPETWRLLDAAALRLLFGGEGA